MASFDKYLVNVSYVPTHVNGQQEVNINGVTQSMPSYSSEYWIASAPEIKLTATGSSQVEAFTNLIDLGNPSPSVPYNQEPLSNIRTW